MTAEVNKASFVNLAMFAPQLGIIPAGERNWKLAQEYAKQEAIAFGEWLNDNYHMDDGGFYHNDYQNKTRFTTEQLYNLYLESKKQ